jgi:ribonuclease HI
MNPLDIPTYQSHDGKTLSTLDITATNTKALDLDLIRDWCIDPDITFGSDHYGTLWTVDLGSIPIDLLKTERINWKLTDEEIWQKELKRRWNDKGISLPPLPTPSIPTQTIEDFAKALHETIAETTEATAHKTTPSAISKAWWTKELDGLRQDLAARQKMCKFYLVRFGEHDESLNEERRSAAKAFANGVHKAKAEHFTNILEDASTNDIWKYKEWWKGKRTYRSPPISTGPDTPPAVTHSEKCAALRATLLPVLPQPERHLYPDLNSPLPDELPFQLPSKEEIRKALFEMPQDKAPGPDGIPVRPLRWAWQVLQDDITTLISWCIKEGYHPLIWKESTSVVLAKANKPDYSKPRAYRLIALLNTLGKLLEKVQASRLSYLAATYGLLPAESFGGAPGKSVVDAAQAYVYDVDCARNHKLVTSSLTIDITGFFDNVSHTRLLKILRDKKLPTPLIKWVESFLTNRQTAVRLDGQTTDMEPVNIGLPQGSPVSPILAAYSTSPLNEKLLTHTTTHTADYRLRNSATRPALITYVDDGNLYVSSQSLQTNIEILQETYAFLQDLASEENLQFDHVKRELIHISNRRTEQRTENLPSITLPNPDGTTTNISPVANLRWLGFHLDSKLSFKHHVQIVTTKAAKALNGLKMLSNTVKGLHQTHLRRLYIACVMPIMTFGCEVWWDRSKTHNKTLSDMLTKIQNKALRWIAASFKTTPIAALELETSTPPVEIRLDRLSNGAALRLHRLDPYHPLSIRLLPPRRFEGNPVSPPLPFQPPRTRHHPQGQNALRTNAKKPRLHTLAELTPSSTENIDPFAKPPWHSLPPDVSARLKFENVLNLPTKQLAAKNHINHIKKFSGNSRHILIYTDGSQLPNPTDPDNPQNGAAYAAYSTKKVVFSQQIGLGTQQEVFDNELHALANAAKHSVEYALTTDHQIRHLHFYADNTSAISSLEHNQAGPGQYLAQKFLLHITSFLENDERNTVEIQWSPGHNNIPGNELADKLAKLACSIPPNNPINPSFSHVKRHLQAATMKKWKEKWEASPPTGAYAYANHRPPSKQPPPHFYSLSRELYGRVTQSRTGHAFVGEYYQKMNIRDEPTACPCGAPLQTREHILFDCPRYLLHRKHIRNLPSSLQTPIQNLLGTTPGITKLAKFLSTSGAFTKTGRPRPARRPPDHTDEEVGMAVGPTPSGEGEAGMAVGPAP